MPSSRAGQPDGVQCRGDRDAVGLAGPALEHGDLVVAQVAAEADQFGGVAGDLLHLGARLGDLRGRVDAEHAARPVLSGEPGDHAGVGAAGHGAHDDRVEVDAELLLLLVDLVGPVREPQSAQSGGRTRRPGSGTGCRRRSAPPPGRSPSSVLEPDAEAGGRPARPARP